MSGPPSGDLPNPEMEPASFMSTCIGRQVLQMQVLSLGWKVPLEKERTTHSSILAWEMSWTEESGALFQRVTKSWT